MELIFTLKLSCAFIMHNNVLGDIKLVQRVMCGRWVCEGGGREGDREPGASSALFMNGMERLHGRARSRARLDPASAVQHFDARAERVCGAQISIPSRHRSRDFCTSPLASRRGTGGKKIRTYSDWGGARMGGAK